MEPTNSRNLMPVLFLGHGSPTNALEVNEATAAMRKLGEKLPHPKSILVISAHWMTQGTWVTHMDQPRVIYDFHGFPKELYQVPYPAKGNPLLATALHERVPEPRIQLDDHEWGLDHGTWSVLKHLYPKADIPVVQLSLDMSQPPSFQYELGQKISFLRGQGVLIVGSGNIVHNLRLIDWERQAEPYDWALEFDNWVKTKIVEGDHKALVNDFLSTEMGQRSVPTLDHYLPFLTVLGAGAGQKDQFFFDVEGFQNKSISMRSVRFGNEV